MPDIQNSDEKILSAVLAGDKSEFGVVVQRYWPVAIALATTRVYNSADAEDVAQRSFIKAYINLASLRDKSRFAGWLSKIVIQESADFLRSKKKNKSFSIDEYAGAIAAPLTSNPGLTGPQKIFVRDAVASLSEKYRLVIIMRFIGGFNATQIARQINEKPHTVRVRLHRAYSMLRESLRPLAMEVEI